MSTWRWHSTFLQILHSKLVFSASRQLVPRCSHVVLNAVEKVCRMCTWFDYGHMDIVRMQLNAAADRTVNKTNWSMSVAAVQFTNVTRSNYSPLQCENQKPNFKPQPQIKLVDGNPVDSVNSFVYFGSFQSSDGYCCPDIDWEIGLAYSAVSAVYYTSGF